MYRPADRCAKALEKYANNPNGVNLIVDDVLTTGNSMEETRRNLGWLNVVGIVIFARGKSPDWIQPMFETNWIR